VQKPRLFLMRVPTHTKIPMVEDAQKLAPTLASEVVAMRRDPDILMYCSVEEEVKDGKFRSPYYPPTCQAYL
jgi:hypothetical protein